MAHVKLPSNLIPLRAPIEKTLPFLVRVSAGNLEIFSIHANKWIIIAPIMGPKGDQGEKGDKGDPGTDAPTIEEILGRIPIPNDGLHGRDGADGKTGPMGDPGRDGRDGLDGQNGIGSQGKPGLPGPIGKMGEPGSAGIDGKNGVDGETPEIEMDTKKHRFRFNIGNKKTKWIKLPEGKQGATGRIITNATGATTHGKHIQLTNENYTAQNLDEGFIMLATDQSFAITLPPAPLMVRRYFWAKNRPNSLYNLEIFPHGSDTIEGEACLILEPGAWYRVYSDGVEWHMAT